MVGTSTSASATAAASARGAHRPVVGVEARRRTARAIRASTGSGSLRVTTTFGLRSAMVRFEKGLGAEGGR